MDETKYKNKMEKELNDLTKKKKTVKNVDRLLYNCFMSKSYEMHV